MAAIKHSEVLRRMDSGEKFDLVFVTCNRRNKTGGQLTELLGVRKHRAGQISPQPSAIGTTEGSPSSRNPNHKKQGTINIKTTGQTIIKVHTRLMVSFNKQEIIL